MSAEPQRVIHLVSTGTIIKTVLVLLGLVLLFVVRDILLIFFVALILSALIVPLAEKLEERKVPRALTVLGVYILLIVLLLLIVSSLIPPIVGELRELAANFSVVWQKTLASIGALSAFGQGLGVAEGFGGLEALSAQIPRFVQSAFTGLTGAAGGLFSLVIVFVLTFYMVVEGEGVKRFIRLLAPAEYETYVVGILTRVQKKLGSWMRAQLILSGIVALLVYIALLILGMPYALVLALLSGLLEFVPYAGPVLGAIPGVLIALSISPLKALLVLAAYLLVQQIENHLLVPKISQKIIGINPIVSILALLLGARLAGFLGVLVAIPIAASLTMLVEDFVEHGGRGRQGT
ncbi:AI-2E family transporter [Patescibacteria group bacterium]|nr:MAG: AI-2E family transporter [Patescibacteria group bacterium]